MCSMPEEGQAEASGASRAARPPPKAQARAGDKGKAFEKMKGKQKEVETERYRKGPPNMRPPPGLVPAQSVVNASVLVTPETGIFKDEIIMQSVGDWWRTFSCIGQVTDVVATKDEIRIVFKK